MPIIKILGAPVEEGASRAGCRLGPAALRAAGLVEALAGQDRTVIDEGDIRRGPVPPASHHNPAVKALAEVAAWTRAIARATYAASAEAMPIVLGGDHSIAAGTIPALAARVAAQKRKLFVLWLDAHADFHTLDTTRSGNLHGIPLAYVAGRAGFAGWLPPLSHPVPPEWICLMGLRSVDAAERSMLATTRMTIHDMTAMQARGSLPLLGAFLDRVAREDGVLHVSLDVDFLDPTAAPAVGTGVGGGPGADEAFAMMALLADSGLVGSLDIAELNPRLDRDGGTARLLVDLTATLMGRPFVHSTTRRLQHG